MKKKLKKIGKRGKIKTLNKNENDNKHFINNSLINDTNSNLEDITYSEIDTNKRNKLKIIKINNKIKNQKLLLQTQIHIK